MSSIRSPIINLTASLAAWQRNLIGCFLQQCLLGPVVRHSSSAKNKAAAPGSNWIRPAVLWVKSLRGLDDPSSTCTEPGQETETLSAKSQTPGACRATASHLDSDICRVNALPAALDPDLERPCRLTGYVAVCGQLHPRPVQLQSAGDTLLSP